LSDKIVLNITTLNFYPYFQGKKLEIWYGGSPQYNEEKWCKTLSSICKGMGNTLKSNPKWTKKSVCRFWKL